MRTLSILYVAALPFAFAFQARTPLTPGYVIRRDGFIVCACRRPLGSFRPTKILLCFLFDSTHDVIFLDLFSLLSGPTLSPVHIHDTQRFASSLNLSLRNPFANHHDGGPTTQPLRVKKSHVRKIVQNTALGLLSFALLTSTPAFAAGAAAKGVEEHLHTGQKIANFFMKFGLPKWAVLAAISAMPVVELRGAVPVGVWMGLPITQVLPICVLGNMAPIIPILFLLRNQTLK